MRRDEIEAHLKKYDNLMELMMEAGKLKKNGEKETVVNNVVTKLRKNLVRQGSKVRQLPRVSVAFEQRQPVGYLSFQVGSLSKPIVAYDGNTVLI